jgi:hypothetical protein
VADPRDPFSDDALAAAYRAARTPAGTHLSDEDWERLTCDELRGADRDRALAHIESCGDCATIHRSLLDLKTQATALQAGDAVPAPAAGGYRWPLFGGLAAAAALVAAVLINLPDRAPLPADDAVRSGDALARIAVISPAVERGLIDRRFEWQPVAGASSYEIWVHTAEGGRVWSTRTSTNTAEIPADVPLSGGAYYWRVTAHRGEATIASSAMVPFMVN